MPEGLVTLLQVIHWSTWALTIVDGVAMYMFELLSGVIQGCPLAGTSFVLQFNPFLRFLGSMLQAPDRMYACADDLLLLLARLSSMVSVARAFALLRAATALKLNLAKCILVPLWRLCSPHVVELVREWLGRVSQNGVVRALLGPLSF